ncbi:heavy-metal-associated domain-containing protein [Bacteroidota bacterium]
MKILLKSILFTTAIFLFSLYSYSQEKTTKIDTSKFEVKGVCNMCKERIENAALIKGVKWVEWDKATDTLTVIYRIDKLNILDVHKSIAEVGHTTDKIECNVEAYSKLPGCCAYMGDAKKH